MGYRPDRYDIQPCILRKFEIRERSISLIVDKGPNLEIGLLSIESKSKDR